MEKQLTTFEISKVLKKLGFEEECFGFYTNGEFTFEKNWVYDRLTSRDVVLTLRPTWSQVIDYIREKHNIHIVIDKVCNIDLSKTYWNYELTYVDNEDIIMEEKSSGYQSYESVRLESIKHCFNIIDPTWDYLITDNYENKHF